MPGFGDFFNATADLKERETRIGIECNARQCFRFIMAAVANDREFVIDGLIAGALQLHIQVGIDIGRFSGGKSA